MKTLHTENNGVHTELKTMLTYYTRQTHENDVKYLTKNPASLKISRSLTCRLI